MSWVTDNGGQKTRSDQLEMVNSVVVRFGTQLAATGRAYMVMGDPKTSQKGSLKCLLCLRSQGFQ